MSDQERIMNTVKKEIRSLLVPVKEGLTPVQLEREYRFMIGDPIPFRALGYRSTLELVQDIPDVVSIWPMGDGNVILRAIADERTKGIMQLVARQKTNCKSQHSRHKSEFGFGSTCGSRQPRRPWVSQSVPRSGQPPPALPAVVKSELKELLRFSPVFLSDFDKAFVQYFGRRFDFALYGFFSMSEVLNAVTDIIAVVPTRRGSLLTLKESPPLGPDKLPECKVAIPSGKGKQTWLPTVSAAPTRKESPTSGLVTGIQTPTPSPECETLRPQLKPVETPLVNYEERMKQLENEVMAVIQKGGIVSSELKRKIRSIAAQHPEGLLVSKLPGEFEGRFQERLPIMQLGFSNLLELVSSLSDVLRLECKGKQDWLVFDIDSRNPADDDHPNNKLPPFGSLASGKTLNDHKLPCWTFPLEDSKKLETKIVTPYLDVEKSCIMQEIMKKEIPLDAVQNRSLDSLPYLGNRSLVGMFVEYMVSPSQFYVRLYSKATSAKFEDMMIQMRQCYSNKNVTDHYVIPDGSVYPGHLYCVRNVNDKWWYRVTIHRVLNDQEVEVFYPDFGNLWITQKSSLRFLKDCYAKLPAQAILCTLAWTKPIKGEWSTSAILRFHSLCEVKPLVGVVDEYIDGVLHLFLCDTSTDEDIYFHDVLELEGHALICTDKQPSKDSLEPSHWNWQNFSGSTAKRLQLIMALEVGESFEKEKDLAHLESGQQAHGHSCHFAETSYKSRDIQGKDGSKDSHENGSPAAQAQVLPVKDKDPEMPYLEPILARTEICNDNWIPWQSLAEKRNEKAGGEVCSDVTVFPSHASGDEDSSDKHQHSQELVQQPVRISNTTETSVERKESQEPQSRCLASVGVMKKTYSLDPPSSFWKESEEFYITIVDSQQLAEWNQRDVNSNQSSTDDSQPLQAASALSLAGGVPPKKMEDTSMCQVVALFAGRSCCDQGTPAQNALMFTAQLQGSQAFCVSCNPVVALGASARLATSNAYFCLR